MKEFLNDRVLKSPLTTAIGVAIIVLCGFLAWLDPQWRNPGTILFFLGGVWALFSKDKKEDPSKSDEDRDGE